MNDFIAIGDIVIDAFIKLKDVRIDTDHDTGDQGMKEICFRFGDKVEYEDLLVVPAVGNSSNAAVAARRLGLKSALVTNIGDDEHGREDLRVLENEGVKTDFVKVHEGMQSNYHYVLRYGAERTILVKHYEYPYKLEDIGNPKWIYLSSLAKNSISYHHEIASYLKTHPSTKLAFQPGTFQIELGFEALKDVYEETEVFFCNVEEGEKILGMNTLGIEELLKRMRALGPQIVVITDGPKGAYAYDGQNIWSAPMYPDLTPPVDRTGAGDSFSATFISALALGYDIPTALLWGPINSMSVVREIGAQKGLLNQEQIKKYLQEAPIDFKIRKL
ncbi:MAG: hypothetical protein COV96_01615 [Candidatus Zambryskibacteria bacterium CG11_big_fil_rev_8_21_14_0_20_42_18]|uniref:Carbohydrate kinase PfkB domain-containing protein n=1 Tax=Candidatus Zambryskibacteria bacterium CG_4_9_14_3_um_filter_42_15 TaxID=1975112 RepID=A0A2M7WSU2_9BACT|nr:MAG: hypothetical protein COV96_01615 [Candidatus Zambryskibacteria bacterium CG11_big_fil_rev_8_21_14_0_20_42_18]PJA33078.1 MAG: hypothetical protein CO185_00575 [Candidatus Zambryskibacteria bacterium CG_4_9_14_3_um_filter_42_15]